MVPRLCAIIQLCLAFSLILWVLAEPFTGEHFRTHTSLLMVQTAVGKGNRFIDADKLARHHERFLQLSKDRQEKLLREYRRLEQHTQRSLMERLRQSLAGLLFHLPAFTQAWIIFSIAICVLLLLGFDGAANAAWLLPLITLCYSIDNHMHGIIPPKSIDELLLPTEEQLLRDYGHKDGSNQALKQAWERYLVSKWARTTPAADPDLFQRQVEAGEHALTVARVEQRLTHPQEGIMPLGATQKPLFLLCLFCLWNLLLTLLVQRHSPRALIPASIIRTNEGMY